MYRLDRFKDSGRITRAFLPARDLYKFSPQTPKHQLPKTDSSETYVDPLEVDNQGLDSTGPPTGSLDVTENTHTNLLNDFPTSTTAGPQSEKPPFPGRSRPIPPATGMGQHYVLPLPPREAPIPFNFFSSYFTDEPDQFSPQPQLASSNQFDELTNSASGVEASDIGAEEPQFSTPLHGSPYQNSSPGEQNMSRQGSELDKVNNALGGTSDYEPPTTSNWFYGLGRYLSQDKQGTEVQSSTQTEPEEPRLVRQDPTRKPQRTRQPPKKLSNDYSEDQQLEQDSNSSIEADDPSDLHDQLQNRKPKPISRQRSGSYPPPAGKPGNTNDWSRRDHSELRHLGNRPKRNAKPPEQINYDKNGKQTITRTKKTDL